MSYIPDCRTDEFYNEKMLQGADKEFISGFDQAVSSMDNAFDNIDAICDLVEEMPEELSPKDIRISAGLFREFLKNWMEIERNENIVSILDEKEGPDSDNGIKLN